MDRAMYRADLSLQRRTTVAEDLQKLTRDALALESIEGEIRLIGGEEVSRTAKQLVGTLNERHIAQLAMSVQPPETRKMGSPRETREAIDAFVMAARKELGVANFG
jgi:hypothetical protein